MDLEKFFKDLPKIELHAHLNGSLSQATLIKLKDYHKQNGRHIDRDTEEYFIEANNVEDLSKCFDVFKVAHALTSDAESVRLATYNTIREFLEDNCQYLELRTTPRYDSEYMTPEEYLDSVISAIRCFSGTCIVVRLIISVDRRWTLDRIKATILLADVYRRRYPDVVVGVDLCGDPKSQSFANLVNEFELARQLGLKVTLHCAETNDGPDTAAILDFRPDRIGHGVFIHPSLAGDADLTHWTRLIQDNIPVELCLSSNVKCKLVSSLSTHPLMLYHAAGHPIVPCTDDKGVFSTSLSNEYQMIAEMRLLSVEELCKLALESCDHVFAEQSVVDTLKCNVLNFMNRRNVSI